MQQKGCGEVVRLWHEKLLQHIPDAQLKGQHREAAALRGLGWGRKHSTVDYVFTHSYAMLFSYHVKVMEEMIRRGFKVSYEWTVSQYRGKRSEPASYEFYLKNHVHRKDGECIYPEHDDAYLRECLDNLRGKGIEI